MKSEVKKLYKSQKDNILWGVIGGIGEYFDIDPTILRLGYIALLLVTGIFPLVIVYIIACFIIPEQPNSHESKHTFPVSSSTEASGQKKNQASQASSLKQDVDTIIIPSPTPRVENIIDDPLMDSSNIVAGGLKKPNWPLMNSHESIVNSLEKKEEIEYPEPETPTLDSLMDDNDLGLGDLIDE